MPDDSITRTAHLLEPRALEAALVQELDFLSADAVAVLARTPGARSFAVVLSAGASVFSWIEPRALCELALETGREAWPDATFSVWLLEGAALPCDRALLGTQLEAGSLSWSARLTQAGLFEQRQAAAPQAVFTRTAIELAELAAELLQLPGLDPGEQLFARGVDSVASMRLVSHVRERWGVELELRDVFEAARVSELAARIDALRASAGGVVTAAIARVQRERAWPLSAAQLRMWLLSRLADVGPAQHVAGGLRLRGGLDHAALSAAVEQLTQRHESLRTVIEEHAGVPAQRGLAELRIQLRVLRDTELDDAGCVRAAAEPAFDLARGPLWRVWLYERGPSDHLLVLCMHHVISDGWSMELAARELLQLYAASVLPELSVQYLDYVAWEAEQGVRDASVEYWLQLLAGEHTPLELPRTLPRKDRLGRAGRAGRTVAVDLDPSLTAQLRALSVAHGASLFAVLLAGFQLWLSRMTGRDLIRVGVPVLGRQRAAAENLIGCFVNTVVLQLQVEPLSDVATLVRTVDASLRAALAHADVPFETLVRALAPERSAEHTPLFQVTYNHLRVSEPAVVAGLQVERVAREPVGSPFELSLETEEFADGRVRAIFNYPVESFAYETVCELAQLYLHLLAQLVNASGQRLAELTLLSPELLLRYSAPQQSHASTLPDAPVHELVVQQALRLPEQEALVGAGERWTFAQLERSSRALALQLRVLGVGPDVQVGVYVARGPRMVVAALGILRAGGAYVPLDMSYPAARLAFILRDSQLKLVLSGHAAERGSDWPLDVNCLALDSLLESDRDEPLPAVSVHPAQLAYVIYTSGSTGQPKGVGVGHAALQMHLRATGALYDIDERDCALHFSSFSFDAAVENWAMPLTHGARLVISDAEAWTGAQTYEVVQREAVTIVFPPTAHLRLLAQHVSDHSEPAQLGRSLLRAVCVGGEAVLREDHALIMRALAPERFINGYGPTECVVTPLLWRSFARATPEQSYAPIGRAVGERRVYVLDPELTPVPVGVVGELYIAGSGHARGYHARAALTAESFVPDPWSAAPGGRLYRTGDLGRWLANGEVEYIGRRDAQVKLRGYRIELGEIESCLRQYSAVNDAVVVLHEPSAGGKRLVGYVEMSAAGDLHALRAHVSEALPEYMVPAQLVLLPALPKTPNGKVDRNALPQPEAAEVAEYAAPESELERLLAQCWCDVLGLPRVGLDDNFFELGGDSIIALQLVSRARQAGLCLWPKQLFQHQTLRALCAASSVDSAGEILPEPERARIPLTPIQRKFVAQRMPVPQHYNQAIVLRIEKDRALEPTLLAGALRHLVEQHDALRLRYTSGTFDQHYAPVGTWPLSVHADDASTFAQACEHVQRGLNLEHGPVARALLTTLADGSQRLLLVAHHLVVDAVSWRVLIADLALAYGQVERAEPSALPARTSSFRSWSELLQEHAQSTELARELPFWREQLEAAELPCDVPGASLRAGQSAVAKVALSEPQTRDLLRRLPEVYRTQVNDVLLTALARVLCRWAGRDAVSIALEGHGRESAAVSGAEELDLSRSVGWFTSIYPVRLSPALGVSAASLGQAIKAVKEQLRAVPNRGLGYGVLEQLTAAELLTQRQAPRVSFNYLGQVDRTLAESGLFALADDDAGPLQHEDNPLGHWLAIDGMVSEGQLRLAFRYSTAMYHAATIATLADAFRDELALLIAHGTSADAGGVTPLDFPLAALTQTQLDALPLAAHEIEDIYPLSPLQHGMLFHSLFAHGLYVSQLTLDVQGLDFARFSEAWRAAVTRHEVLRTALVEPEPGAGFVQLVHKRAALQITEHDLSAEAEPLSRLTERERAAGFALDQPPLLRLALVRLAGGWQRVIVTHHHVLLDGWSLTRLFEEVLRSYAGERLEGLAPRGSYRRYIAWLASRDAQADRSFWSERLAALEEPSLIAGALPRAAQSGASDAPTQAGWAWSASDSESLQRFAKRERVTVNTLIQAAWAILLQRHLGRDTLCFGVTVAGRPAALPDAQSALGLFINTIPLVVQPAPELQVGAWLRALQGENVALREHEHASLSDLQRWAGRPGQPLFDSLVVFENYPVDRALRERGGAALRVHGFESYDRTNYALTLEAGLDGHLRVQLKSSEQQLTAAQLADLAAQLSHVLTGLTQSATRALGELSLSGARALQQLERWNDTHVPSVGVDNRLVPELIAAAALQHPKAVAVSAGAESLSYAELVARSQQLASYLRARGIGPDALVGVCAERSVELVVALLAVLQAGAAYVPLDPSYPPERLHTMIEDSGAQLVITQVRLLSVLPPLAAERVFRIDRDWSATEVDHDGSAPVSHDDQLAYVIYTSGSTGKPKGVELTHGGFRNYVRWALEAYNVEQIDVSALHSSIAFDLTVTSLWLPLCAGKRVALVPESADALSALAGLVQKLDDSGARALLKITPSHALALSALVTGPLPHVRAWIVGGEALSWECAAALQKLAPNSRVINEYGPTETVVGCSTHDASGDHASTRASSVPIGTAIANMQLYVLDAALQVLPAGVTGELYIGGTALARGYRAQPGLTAERFVPHPLSHTGERLYRTGDLARYRPDGVLEYLGRIDHQIKLRGYRIELAEIEAALRDHAQVSDAVAVARHEARTTRLVGYVAAAAGADAHALSESLYTRLRERLPEYMVPAQLVVLDALPLTSNGKVDRRALPSPERKERSRREPASVPEAQLLEIWRAVLSAPDAAPDDDFFELGGDSLLSLQIISRARALGMQISPKLLFEARTVAQLAIAAATSDRVENGLIARVSRAQLQPLSHAQERLWFLAQLEPDSAAYNVSGALRLRGALDNTRLEAAFAQLVTRHEALRTSFEELEGRGMQRVHAHAALVLRRLNVRGPEAEQCARDAFAEESSRPFRLADPSLLRLLLIGLGERDHVLVVTMHHLVSDAGTVATLLSELQVLYVGGALPAPPALQYLDYAVWQRSALTASELSRQLDYFRAQLGEEHPLIELPTDRPRPAMQSYRGASLRFALDVETSRAVQRLGRERGASAFMVLLSAFEVVLYRLTGQRDLRVGVPMSRRSRVELEGVVGLFVNTLVLRTALDGAATFAELLAQLKRVSLDAQAHSDLPFERLVEALAPERSLSHNPLYQVMFDHQRAPLAGVRSLGELELSSFDKDDTATQLDLGLETFEDADQIHGSFSYATDLFDHASIELLCARFLRVLTQALARPDRKLAELTVLDDAELAALLAAGAPQLAAADAAQPFVHVRIAQQAAERPDAIALEAETGEAPWTYAQLERLSNQWAARLRELGVGPESKVGLCMSRSPRMVMGALAIIKAGAAYVPLDPSYPLARLRAVVDDAEVQCVLGELNTAQSSQLGAATVLLCDQEDVSAYPAQLPAVALSGDNLAYVVYTSGSTGRPKGVGVSHAALAQHVAAIARDYGMVREDRALHFASIGFDAGVEQWVSPLVHGARLFIRGDELWSAERALEVLRERQISWFEMPPGYLHEISRAALERGQRIQLRACSAGGEAVSRESLSTMLRAVSPAPVINGYGPTETVITPMTWHVRELADCRTAYAPIGRVLGPRRSYVLDADLNLVPVGVTGELYLGGLGLARGYLARPDLTAERFVPDPHAQIAGARMYRTGDLARVLSDGNVEYVGRADHQVKVRGFRVELGEIEAQLLAQPGVREAVVVADGGTLAARLLGYVVGDVDLEHLRTQLRAALPEYMVPAQLIALAQLPRNSNGKVDRKQLPAPEQQARGYEPPRTTLEAQLCAILAEVLQLEQVGRNDDFFELGGDSIRSLRVISRARKLGLALHPRDMFRCRGVAELASAAERLPLAAAAPELQPLARDTVYFRLSYAQERLWFLAQLDPNSAAYNISGAVRVRGPLDASALQAALAELGARHEALRTSFEARDGQPWQRLHARSALTLEQHDCRGGGPVSAEEQARLQVEAAADAPFDLETGPLLRVLALRLSESEHVLCLVMHHIISDGWSLDTAIDELSKLYAAERTAQPAGLPELPVQYVDYASWQRVWLLGDELNRQLDYWRGTLGTEHPVLSLPSDHARPQLPTQRGEVVDFVLDEALGTRLHAFARAHDTTLFVVLLAAFQSVLHRLSGQREVRVGVPVTNRNRLETEGVIGLFVNTQVLRSDYDPSLAFAHIVARTRETALSAQANQDLPFERLVELLQPARSMGHNPLFQVMYNHLRRNDVVFAGSPELQASAFEWQSQWSQFDLTLDTEEDARGIVSGRLTYATDLFVRASAQRWAAQYVRALSVLIAAPNRAVGSLSWLAPEERSAQLAAGAAKHSTQATGGLLHERIREQALRHRSRVACSYEGEQLSYGALELRANQWAQRLRKHGVGPDVLVGLCLERSLDLVVAVLAILKAGGAYVPLDPSAPAERVAYMIEDSRLALVLTHSELAPRFAGTTTLCLDREDVRAESREPPVTETRPDQLAYVIYTSGSTGKPKGALLTHHNVTRLFDATAPSFAFDEHDVWTLFHSYAFDFSVWELFGALLYGGCAVVVPYDVSRSPSDFYALLVRERVTVLNQTPSAFRQLSALACAAPEADKAALKLRRVIFGGEALELEALRPWFERFGDQQPQLINMYGITETTVHVTYRPVGLADLENAAVSPIGEPISDLALYVLDEALEPCAWGVTGELYVGGPGLARGYLGRAALSAQRFVPNPFGAGRLYRSGDLALRRENGALEYLGRSDHQVKIRGFRIELGEIASQLQAHPWVREASVIARPGPSGQRLLGYVTCHEDYGAEVVDVLKQHLRRVLPEYMVPASLSVLDALPLTVNGKLDQARLPESTQPGQSFVAPSTETERQLAAIWAELLGVERVGRSDDFFELGGHSLLITQVLSRVQRQFGVTLQLRALFESSTLHVLAASIAEAGATSQSPESQLDALDALLTDLENEA